MLDYDPKSGSVDIRSVDAVLAAARAQGLRRHLVAGDPRPCRPPLRLALREGEDRRQDRHRRAHQGCPEDLPARLRRRRPEDGRQRLRPAVRGRRALLASASSRSRSSTRPGTRPPTSSYRIGDAVFVGDTLFMPDYGTARADFPGGDAHKLYRLDPRLLALPPRDAALHVPRLQGARPGHLPGRRRSPSSAPATSTSTMASSEEDFVAMRTDRDATLAAPACCCPPSRRTSAPGASRPAEANGVRYLKVPVTFKAGAEAF